jgi:hypothetical protein
VSTVAESIQEHPDLADSSMCHWNPNGGCTGACGTRLKEPGAYSHRTDQCAAMGHQTCMVCIDLWRSSRAAA